MVHAVIVKRWATRPCVGQTAYAIRTDRQRLPRGRTAAKTGSQIIDLYTGDGTYCCGARTRVFSTPKAMRQWLTRNREIAVSSLATIVAILILADLIKYRWLTASSLAINKDALAALSSSVSVIAICVGAVFSYYRFFRGRTFYSRAELKIEVTVIPRDAAVNMHAVIVEVKNIGTLPIWSPSLVLTVVQHGPNGEKAEVLDSWSIARSPRGEAGTVAVIDSGETAPFWTDLEFSSDIWAVFYTAFVHSGEGEIWKKVMAVRNKVDEKKKDAP